MEEPKDFSTAEAVEKWLKKQRPTGKNEEHARLVREEPDLGQDVISPTAEALISKFFSTLEAIPSYQEAPEKSPRPRNNPSQRSREFEADGSIWYVEYESGKDSLISVLRQDIEPPQEGAELVDGEQVFIVAGRGPGTQSSILYRASDVFMDWRDGGYGLGFVTNKPTGVSGGWGLLAKLMHASGKEATV